MPSTTVPRHAWPVGRLLLAGAMATAGLTACSSGEAAEGAIELTATDSACEVARTDLAAGNTTFAISNEGDKVTEVYVYAKSGDAFSRVVTEKANIEPGSSYELTVSLKPGTYEVACKPGQTGDGIRQQVTVTKNGETVEDPAGRQGRRCLPGVRAAGGRRADPAGRRVRGRGQGR